MPGERMDGARRADLRFGPMGQWAKTLVTPQAGGQQGLEMRAHLNIGKPIKDFVQKAVGD